MVIASIGYCCWFVVVILVLVLVDVGHFAVYGCC